MHPKQTPSYLNSNKEKTIVHLFFQGGRAGGSSVSILEKPIEKNKLVTTITPPALPPSFLEPSGSGGSSVSVDDVSSRSPVVATSTSSVSRGVSPPGVS